VLGDGRIWALREGILWFDSARSTRREEVVRWDETRLICWVGGLQEACSS
jgi:hypothetical protein